MRPSVCVPAILAAAILVLGAASARAQEVPRRRICLALGGGGARGAAHIGVLKVLEELHVPVNCIAGTSMGSIVGGLYAIGYTPDELTNLVDTTDWLGLFNDDPPRKELSFRRKEDDFLHPVGLEFGLHEGLAFGGGLIAGRKLSFLLQSLTLRAAGVTDFDLLDIPFRAVAADVVNGEAVILGTGNLGKALRASMAIPVVFTPVEIDGRLLIDGGNAENLPVQTAKAMGADVVIAVDVGASGVIPKEKPKSATAILSRLSDIPLLQNAIASRRLADVVLQPDLTGFGTADFTKAAEIVPKGEAVARANIDLLKQYAIPAADYEVWRQRHRKAAPPPPAIKEVTVAPVKNLDSRRVTHFVHSKPGKTLDLHTLEKDLARLYGTGLFENVEFEVQGTGPEKTLNLEATPKPWGPTYLRVGLGLSTDFNGDSDWALLALVNATEMNRLGALWKTAFTFGSDVNLLSQFYQPLGYTSDFFAAPRVSFQQRTADVFDSGGNRVAQYRTKRWAGGFDLGYDFGPVAELRSGLEWGHLTANKRTGLPEFPDLDTSSAAWISRLRVDQLDNVSIPKSGYFFDVEFRAERTGLGSNFNYERFDSTALGAFTLGRFTTIGKVRWGDPLGSNVVYTDWFTLGGFLNLSGYAPDQLRGPSVGFGEAVFLYRLSGGGALLKNVYLGVSGEAGTTWAAGEGRSFNDLKGAGAVFFAADTGAGPFFLGWGYGGSGRSSFYLILNRNF